MDEDHIKEWLPKIRAGSERHFQMLYDETIQNVYRTVHFLHTHPQDAEDIVSEIYIAVWHSLHKYDHERSFRYWLHGIVVRKVQDSRRKAWRRFRILERKKNLEPPIGHQELQAIYRKETGNELFHLLSQLSAKHREVVALRYYHDYSIEEIAALLHIPEGTVKSRIHHALKRLREKATITMKNEEGENYGF